MRVLLTGVTGHLGRHVMFEYILRYWDNLDDLELVLLGRGNETANFERRIRSILLDDGLDYLKSCGSRWTTKFRLTKFLRNNIRFIECHLDAPEMGLRAEDRQLLENLSIDQVFHVAALTEFGGTKSAEEKLSLNILQGTKCMLELASSLNIDVFNYISTAYVCGITAGQIMPEPTPQNREFRNLYEGFKVQAEALIPHFERQSGIKCRIFRPSIICGRMMEGTAGTTNKFDVFYGWASFFVKENMKKGNDDRCGSMGTNAPIRISRNPRAGLNIVPVDYCAKLMLAICHANAGSGIFHLTHEQEVPHDQWMPQVMSQLGIKNYLLTESEPTDKSEVEQRYYRTVGKLFQGYFSTESLEFDMSNSRQIRSSVGLNCPALDESGFAQILSFAGSKNFGVPIKNDLQPNIGRKFALACSTIKTLAPWAALKKRQTSHSGIDKNECG